MPPRAAYRTSGGRSRKKRNAGSRITAPPRPGCRLAASKAVNITLFSYDGRLQIGVNTDAAAVEDPELFVACLEKGIAGVQSVA